MSYILSENRDGDFDKMREDWDSYRSYLASLRTRFPQSAFEIATSDWWYQGDLAEAPHDSRLLAIRMGDYGSSTWDNNQFSWIEIDLHSAYSGTIQLRYPRVYRYDLKMAEDSRGIHGDWRYDEFALTDNGHLLHTIQWADGAVWLIEASDIEHSYAPGEEKSS